MILLRLCRKPIYCRPTELTSF